MKYINIDEALKLPQTFNVLMNALDELYAKRQEEFQKSNPLTEIYQMVSLNQFQKSFGSSTGFKQAFEQTVDYATYPGFSSGDGFRATISYKAFNGKIVFTWQTILEADYSGIKDTLSNFQVAWQRQVVEYGLYALTAMFGSKVYDSVSKTYLKICSADTTDGDPMTETKNAVFSNTHTIVKTDGMTAAEFNAYKQSNKFYINVALDGTDPLAYAKLANGLHQIRVRMSKYFDDNGKRAGVNGRKKIVATEDAQLQSAIESVMAAEDFSYAVGKPTLNQVKNGFDRYYTPYLDGNYEQLIPQFATGNDGIAKGLLILDPAYNKVNHGPMMVERVGFSLKAVKTDEPEGIKYLGKQAFDFFCPSWRGIAYVYIGLPAGEAGHWDDVTTFTEITPVVYANAVQVINTASNPVHVDLAADETVGITGEVEVTNDFISTNSVVLSAPIITLDTNTLTVVPGANYSNLVTDFKIYKTINGTTTLVTTVTKAAGAAGIDLSTLITGAGTYTITAKAVGAPDLADSAASESVSYVVSE